MFGATPQCGQTKLSIGVQGRFFEDAFPWAEELINKWIIQARLPFLDQSQLKTSVVSTFSVDWERSPNVQAVMLFPVAKSQFGLDQPIVAELKNLSGATVFAVQGVMHCGPNIEFGLHVHNMGETKIDTLGLEKLFGEKVVRSQCRSPKIV